MPASEVRPEAYLIMDRIPPGTAYAGTSVTMLTNDTGELHLYSAVEQCVDVNVESSKGRLSKSEVVARWDLRSRTEGHQSLSP